MVDQAVTALDPESRFPGLPDGMAYSVAAVVEARTAGLWVLVSHLRESGCPVPIGPDSYARFLAVLASAVADVEYAAWDADWPDELRGAVVDACIDIEGLISHIREVTR